MRHPVNTWESLAERGKYLVRREFEYRGQIYAKAIECNNPAFGYVQLDDWQLKITMPVAIAA